MQVQMARTRGSGHWLGAAADRLELHRRKASLLVEGGRDFLDRVHKEDEGAECHDSMEGEADKRSQDGRPRGLGDDVFELHELTLVLVDLVLRLLPINLRLGVRCLLQHVAHGVRMRRR